MAKVENLLVIPFHDWKISCKEGFRTRDAHLYEAYTKIIPDKKIIILNRPTTLIEILLRLKKYKTPGKIIHTSTRFHLVEVKPNVYVLDVLSKDLYNIIVNRYEHYTKMYDDIRVFNALKYTFKLLNIENYSCYVSSLFSIKLICINL